MTTEGDERHLRHELDAWLDDLYPRGVPPASVRQQVRAGIESRRDRGKWLVRPGWAKAGAALWATGIIVASTLVAVHVHGPNHGPLAVVPSNAARPSPTSSATGSASPSTSAATPLRSVVVAGSPNPSSRPTPGGSVCAAAPAGRISEIALAPSSGPQGIATGADGNIWFIEAGSGDLGRYTVASGAISTFPVQGAGGSINDGEILINGPDGRLWWNDSHHSIIHAGTTNGTIANYDPGSGINGIASGPDGAVWFTDTVGNHVGRVPVSGSPPVHYSAAPGAGPKGITAGPDGLLWVANFNAGSISKIAASGTVIATYPTGSTSSGPTAIVAGPSSDGSVWFTENPTTGGVTKIGRITLSGAVTEFTIPTAWAQPQYLTLGADCALWFTETATNKVGRVDVHGTFTEYNIPTTNSAPAGICEGPDGAIWFTEAATGKLGRLT